MKVRCTNCRQYFPKEQVRRLRIGNVCSDECGNALRAKPRPRKPKRTSSTIPEHIRQQVLKRDGRRCRACTRPARHLHHIRYRSEGVDHAPHNLVTLCQECHDMVHGNKRLYKPLLLGMMWRHYVDGVFTTLPQFTRWYESQPKGLQVP